MSSRPFGVGSYTHHVAETVDPFNQRVMAFKNDDASALEDSRKLERRKSKSRCGDVSTRGQEAARPGRDWPERY